MNSTSTPSSADLTPLVKPLNRIPSLDGLRAISIGLVIGSHVICARGFPHAAAFAKSPLPYYFGNLGVRIFFVISGFLITSLLLAEQQRTGSVAFVRFYRRRAFRILPVFCAYILTLLLLTAFGVVAIPRGSFLIAASLTADIFQPQWYFGHFWSLSVEEQFYILWPLAVGTLNARWRELAAAALFFTAPLLSALLLVANQKSAAEAMSSFSTVAAGCLLALARNRQDWERYRRVLFSRWTFAGCFALLGVGLIGHRYARYIILATTISILGVIGIDYLTRCDRWFSRFLNWRPVAFVGVLSYSLYIWQQLFLRIGVYDRGLRFPFNLIATIGAALLSYFLIEKPFIHLKDTISMPKERRGFRRQYSYIPLGTTRD
jgi:peptidoglycan/LPS O-acetylase OafA/YrhL